VKNLSYSYEGPVPALSSIDLVIHPGEIVALLGSNGCGKSTLLKILDGLYYPSSGTVIAFGTGLSEDAFRDESFNSHFRARVGFLFQDSDVQLFLPTVQEELAFAPLQMELSSHEVKQRVDQALHELDIEPLRDRAPHQLSSGEKKKVALASLLTLVPEIWLMDEPSAGLDPRSVAWLIDFIYLQHQTGKTIVIASHDLDLIRAVADRVYVMDETHSVIAEGITKDVLNDPALLRQANLIR
jgi:cobalt/nickel transport system ATP-binding protein